MIENASYYILKELVEYLEEKFPNKLPTNRINTDELMIRIGNQQVIEAIRAYIAYKEGK